jgi:hypothetical protein
MRLDCSPTTKFAVTAGKVMLQTITLACASSDRLRMAHVNHRHALQLLTFILDCHRKHVRKTAAMLVTGQIVGSKETSEDHHAHKSIL